MCLVGGNLDLTDKSVTAPLLQADDRVPGGRSHEEPSKPEVHSLRIALLAERAWCIGGVAEEQIVFIGFWKGICQTDQALVPLHEQRNCEQYLLAFLCWFLVDEKQIILHAGCQQMCKLVGDRPYLGVEECWNPSDGISCRWSGLIFRLRRGSRLRSLCPEREDIRYCRSLLQQAKSEAVCHYEEGEDWWVLFQIGGRELL